MSMHGDWKKIKAKGKKLPSNFFDQGLGPACDEFENAKKAYEKTKDVDKEAKLMAATKAAAKKVSTIMSAYAVKLKNAKESDDAELSESADAVLSAAVGFMNNVNGLKKTYKF